MRHHVCVVLLLLALSVCHAGRLRKNSNKNVVTDSDLIPIPDHLLDEYHADRLGDDDDEDDETDGELGINDH